MRLLWLFPVTLLCAASWGCSDDGPSTGSPDGGEASCEDTFSLDQGHPNGHGEPLGAGPDQARAGRLEEAELPTDPTGLAVWEAGDFVLANERIAVLIEDVGDSDLHDPFGGKIVGLAQVEAGRLVAPASFREIIPALGRFTLGTESVTVLADGSDGGPATIRAAGLLSPIPFIDPVLAPLLPEDLSHIRAAIDYTLAPGAEHVDISGVLINPSARIGRAPSTIDVFLQRHTMPAYAPEVGFDVEAAETMPYVAFADDDATSFAWKNASGDLSLSLEVTGALAMSAPGYLIPACSEDRYDLNRLYVGGPGIEGLRMAIARTEGETHRGLSGVVTTASGEPASGVRVHAENGDGYVTRTRTDDQGRYSLRVPPGDVSLSAWALGFSLLGPVEVGADQPTADLRMGPTGTIRVEVQDGMTGRPLPARVQVVPRDELRRVPKRFGEAVPKDGRLHVAFMTGEPVTLRAPVGTHEVRVSRGYEYELLTETVEVLQDTTAQVDARLERVVDTTDVLCADLHIHTHRSSDSPDSVRYKLASAAADGLEIPTRSDHNWVGDFEPMIEAMGLGGWLYGVGSVELTTFTWGHVGVLPLDALPDQRNAGAFEWTGRLPPEVFAEVRARRGRHGAPAIIINHPRSSNFFGPLKSYFFAAGYDPVSMSVSNPEFWDDGFKLIEVFNDSSFDENFDPTGEEPSTVMDWFSLLNSGRTVFAVGSSDSHEVSDSPVGYPRTCVRLGTDDPNEMRAMGAGVLRDQLLEGRATVSGGIYLEASARDGAGPGQRVSGADAMEMVDVTVQAASWIEADLLRVYVDGALVESITLSEETRDESDPVVRFREAVQVPVESGPLGSWVVFVASGSEGLDVVHPGREAFGVTNPIFFER